MTVGDIVQVLDLNVFSGADGLNREVTGGYVSDLLSDVMGKAKEGQLWVTLQTHKNVLAVASLKDLSAVLLVNRQKPDEDMARQSEEENIPVVGTTMDTFTIAGKLYELISLK